MVTIHVINLVVSTKQSNNGVVTTGSNNLLMHHQTKDAHHGRTTIVELDATLSNLFLGTEGIPTKIDESIAEITRELTLAGHVLHDKQFQKSNEQNDLTEAFLGDGVLSEECGEAIGVGIEGVSSGIDASGQVKAGAGHDLAQEGELCDTAVLELDVTEAVEAGLVGSLEEVEGIVEAEGFLCSDLVLEGLQAGSRSLLGGRGEGGGRGEEGGGDGELHFRFFDRLK
mmetsp:Transcript_12469/g.18741  ORF Transcript_12469/g.18741 Transcript_12469/m.18741 type:complete len:227 (-) Transcript_12469:42-722(-)